MQEMPQKVKAMLQIGETGVDEYGCVMLQFKNGTIGQCRFGIKVNMDEMDQIRMEGDVE